MRVLADQELHHDTDELVRLAELEFAEGRQLPGDFVALIRRTEMTLRNGTSRLGPISARIVSPVVNPGEAWSDRALAELAGLGEDWHRLIAHAATATATAARPSAKWDKAGRGLIEAGAGSGALPSGALATAGGQTAHPPLGTTEQAGESFDAYNAIALRGLSWLLSLLPPHPESARALGSLVETSLRKVPRLIPRLAIVDRCTLEGRFLHVEGDRHTYKIHLGSGNILMTPDDWYPCIVPGPNRPPRKPDTWDTCPTRGTGCWR